MAMKRFSCKRQCLNNASYNLDLVEQRLILWLLLKQGKWERINNDPLEVHADSYINQFGVHHASLSSASICSYQKKANGKYQNV
jgi:hypothetical protein